MEHIPVEQKQDKKHTNDPMETTGYLHSEIILSGKIELQKF